ncbi:hypothetical protein MRX96_024557 [Rhipicephalus microplus]
MPVLLVSILLEASTTVVTTPSIKIGVNDGTSPGSAFPHHRPVARSNGVGRVAAQMLESREPSSRQGDHSRESALYPVMHSPTQSPRRLLWASLKGRHWLPSTLLYARWPFLQRHSSWIPSIDAGQIISKEINFMSSQSQDHRLQAIGKILEEHNIGEEISAKILSSLSNEETPINPVDDVLRTKYMRQDFYKKEFSMIEPLERNALAAMHLARKMGRDKRKRQEGKRQQDGGGFIEAFAECSQRPGDSGQNLQGARRRKMSCRDAWAPRQVDEPALMARNPRGRFGRRESAALDWRSPSSDAFPYNAGLFAQLPITPRGHFEWRPPKVMHRPEHSTINLVCRCPTRIVVVVQRRRRNQRRRRDNPARQSRKAPSLPAPALGDKSARRPSAVACREPCCRSVHRHT